MGWIKIKKDNEEFLVSTASYNKVFQYQGYEVISEKVAPTPITPKPKQENIVKEAKANDGARKKTNRQVKV